jgi:hypothetical protein
VRFGKPYPAPRPPGWGKLGNYERALWRWNWCNGRIEQLRPACEAFVTVRYEDLFAADESSRTATMRDITNALGIGELVHAHLANMSERANASTARQAIADRSAAAAICGALARAYGYDY